MRGWLKGTTTHAIVFFSFGKWLNAWHGLLEWTQKSFPGNVFTKWVVTGRMGSIHVHYIHRCPMFPVPQGEIMQEKQHYNPASKKYEKTINQPQKLSFGWGKVLNQTSWITRQKNEWIYIIWTHYEISHQPRISLPQLHFGVGPCEITIIRPDICPACWVNSLSCTEEPPSISWEFSFLRNPRFKKKSCQFMSFLCWIP